MNLIKNIDKALSVALLVGLTLLGFIQVIFRFVFNLPLDWSEEFIRYILIVLIYLSTVITVREGNMIRIELIDLILKGKPKQILDIIIDFVCFVFLLYISYLCIFLVKNAIFVNQTSPALNFPLSIMYAMESLMFLLMALMFVKHIILKIQTFKRGTKKC